MLKNIKLKKAIALFIASAIALTVLFSFCFAAREAEHLCSGAECLVCCALHSCFERLSLVSTRMTVLFLLFGIITALSALPPKKPSVEKADPITLRVKLSN